MDGYVVTIGVFDGVHVGHRALFNAARLLARRHGAGVLAMAFDPHPACVLRPAEVPPRLASADAKAALLQEAGADVVRLVPPTRALLERTAGQFLEHLVAETPVRAVVEGPDFRFGKDRRGDVETLRRGGERLGFDTHIVDPVRLPLHDQLVVTVRSSMIRWLLAHGRVADAARCLGQPFAWRGTVVRGEGRGRQIGFPTANIRPSAKEVVMLPADGVYAAEARIDDGPPLAAALSVGRKPTFGGPDDRVVEAHLLDFDGDLYGRSMVVFFRRWLRDQVRFTDVDDLKRQITRDVAAIRSHTVRDPVAHAATCFFTPPEPNAS